ncbi:GMC family oxidoreductase [Mesorhizobium sp. M0309]|uniref:GMC family oxidoreductase n=1 Tax=Mesorhizobium sp. M0309 TaxID=2956933 RepID=UPI00333BD98F
MDAEYDVIVVGSGVAGALCAWQLTQLGHHKILILEAGDNGTTLGQRIQFHHTMDVQGNRGDMFAPYKELRSREFAPAPENAQLELAQQKAGGETYYDYTEGVDGSKDAFKAGYNRMVGGTTWSWRGNCPRYIPSDFKLKELYGVGRDWPFGYEELEPWYCHAERELGVSGNHDELDGLWGGARSQSFPMPGIPWTFSDKKVADKIQGRTVRGTRINVVTTPQARNSVPYDARPACEGHSNCIPLCPIQAKYDATVHLNRLLHTGKVTLKTAAVVIRLELGADSKIGRVVYRDWKSDDFQQERFVRGKVIVLAAHAIETPKLLLMSGNLANSSGMVGRNLMDHVQFELIATFPEPIYPFRGPQSVTGIEAFRDGAFRSQRSAFRMTIGNDGWGRAGSPATVIDELAKAGSYGSSLPGAVSSEISRMIRLSFSTEMLADAKNRVQLSNKTDPGMGLPRPMFTFDIGAYVQDGLREGFETAKELFALMGAQISPKAKPLEPGGGARMNWNTAAHIMGTCIMGDKPSESVVNRWGRTHDVDNLWIVGSSVFPTSATSNPTLTIAALALRSGSAIHRALH